MRKANGSRGTGIVAVALALTLAAPAVAQDRSVIKVGVLDLHATQILGAKEGVSIKYREFTPAGKDPGRAATPAGPDHGQIVATAAVEQIRRLDGKARIEVYAANAFGMKQGPDGSTALKLDFEQGTKALQWMSENGVRVVVTAFNSKNEAGSRMLMDKAESLGMIVFAGAPNVAGAGKVFPAADERSVSVVDSAPDMALHKDPTIATWVRFAMDGTITVGARSDRSREIGSSYASAKAGGIGAFVATKMSGSTREEVVSVLEASSRPTEYRAAGQTVSVKQIGGREGEAEISGIIASQGISRKTSVVASLGPVDGVMGMPQVRTVSAGR